MDIQVKLLSYGALNALSITSFAIAIYRMVNFKNIYNVNLFLILSPLILASMFYCAYRWTGWLEKKEYIKKKKFYLLTFYLLIIILWIIMLLVLDWLYNNIAIISSYLGFVGSIIYAFGAICTICIIYSAAKNEIHPVINLNLSILIYGILFLKTLDSIKGDNGIDTSFFVSPYMYLMIANIGIWFTVSFFIDRLRDIEKEKDAEYYRNHPAEMKQKWEECSKMSTAEQMADRECSAVSQADSKRFFGDKIEKPGEGKGRGTKHF